jgi:hypothetical protein
VQPIGYAHVVSMQLRGEGSSWEICCQAEEETSSSIELYDTSAIFPMAKLYSCLFVKFYLIIDAVDLNFPT